MTTLTGNQMAQALVNAGLGEMPKQKKPRPRKKFNCHKCKTNMVQPENTNVMYCPKCDHSFFVFTGGR